MVGLGQYMSTIKHLVATLRRQSLKIRVGEVSEVFASPHELCEFLRPRLEVPSERVDAFGRLDERALQREARKMLQAHQNVMDVMVSARETGEPLQYLWRRLDISKVPDDHDWPSLLFAIGSLEHIPEGYQSEALSMYLRFLEARRNALEKLRPHRVGARRSKSSLTVSSRAVNGSAAPSPDAVRASYARLPHCHVVQVDLEEKPDITVMLGSNRFHLAKHGDDVVLRGSDEADGAHALKLGRNTIGRSAQCDVHLDDQNSDVSRQHLIVEINAGRRISLMDVSSRGTYVRPEFLNSARSDTLTRELR